jgi:phage protein U
VQELQHLAAGMNFPASTGATEGFMQRKQLLGIAERAERAAQSSLVESKGTLMAWKNGA